jgi:acetyl esterase/lipase
VTRDSFEVTTDPPPPPADKRLVYGPEPLQFGDLRRAGGGDGDSLAVVLHGGSWKSTYNLIHLAHLCIALRDLGVTTFNVEYRRVGDPGGGWPGSFDDVVRAVEFAGGLASRLVVVGHSAGGHLGLLAAARLKVRVIALAPVADPATWDNPAVEAFFGRRPPPPEGSPLAQLPLGFPHVVMHGTEDTVVPFDQAARYAAASGGEAELVPLPGAGHFEPIDPLAPESAAVCDVIRRVLAAP